LLTTRWTGTNPSESGWSPPPTRQDRYEDAQHHTAFEPPDTTLLGEPPHPLGNEACASSHRAAVQAIERLDWALGRQPAIEPPQRSLGISL
jgi:hypothetical protein